MGARRIAVCGKITIADVPVDLLALAANGIRAGGKLHT